MAYPTIVCAAVSITGSNGTSHVVTLPSGITVGDQLRIYFSNDGIATISATGWTEKHTQINLSDSARLTVLQRVADGTEGATVTVTTSGSEQSSAFACRISGSDPATPSAIASLTPASSTSLPDPPSVTPSWGAEDNLVVAVANWDNNLARTLSSYPSSCPNNQAWASTAGTANAPIAIATCNLTASPADPTNFTISGNEQWAALTEVFRPDPGGGTDINLDLVTFANTYPDVTILENIVESLDLVSYSSTFPDMTLTENIDVDLDLVTYSSTFPDLTITENEVVPLDLVSYSSTVNDLTVLEHEIVLLDLVSYSSSFPDVTILENEVILLDLVAYTSSYPDVVLEEQSVIDLDLVTYSSSFPDLTVLENEIIVLDLVSYSSSVQDLTVTENEMVSLDLVTYSSSVLDLTVLEDGDIDLDLVTYTVNVPDITVLESVIELLDLVTYSSTYPDLTVVEDSDIALDLVVFTSVVNDVLLVSPYDDITTPLSRIYSVPREYRVFAIVKGKRIMPVAFRSRVYPIR